jgi:hypothetical protein
MPVCLILPIVPTDTTDLLFWIWCNLAFAGFMLFATCAALWVGPAPFAKIPHLKALEVLRGHFLELLNLVETAVEENSALLKK